MLTAEAWPSAVRVGVGRSRREYDSSHGEHRDPGERIVGYGQSPRALVRGNGLTHTAPRRASAQNIETH